MTEFEAPQSPQEIQTASYECKGPKFSWHKLLHSSEANEAKQISLNPERDLTLQSSVIS